MPKTTKLCKLSHIRETKDERRVRLDARALKQLSLDSDMVVITCEQRRIQRAKLRREYVILGLPPIFPNNQIVVGKYRPHQGELECARRAYPGLSRSTALREFRFFRDNPRS